MVSDKMNVSLYVQYMLIFEYIVGCLKHTPEEHSSIPGTCTTGKSTKRKQSDEIQPTDWKKITVESKLTTVSESEGLTNSDVELQDNAGHPKRAKYL